MYSINPSNLYIGSLWWMTDEPINSLKHKMRQLIWKTLNFIAKSYRAKATVKFIIFLTDLGQVKEHAVRSLLIML